MKQPNKYKVQVNKSHYDFDEYLDTSRWTSYYHQIQSVHRVARLLGKKHPSVLVVGVGDRIVVDVLKSMGMRVVTVDIDPKLKPDYVRTLPRLNFPKRMSFDSVLCAEVLEHITYDDAEESLHAMSDISRFVIISVPHKSAYVSVTVKLPFLSTWKYIFSIPVSFLTHKFRGEHYWELGMRGYSVQRFKNSLSRAGFLLLKDFRVAELPWHHFFLSKRQK